MNLTPEIRARIEAHQKQRQRLLAAANPLAEPFDYEAAIADVNHRIAELRDLLRALLDQIRMDHPNDCDD